MTATRETSSQLERRWRLLPKTLPAGAALCVAGALAWFGWGATTSPTTSATQSVQQPAFGYELAPSGASASSGALAVTPVRSTSHQPPPFVLPTLLPELANPARLTIELETRQVGTPGGAVQRKTVTRTADRVHVSLGPSGPEWLFVQNTADGRRMAGTMLDHPHKTIIEYDESELRSGGVGRGWADVVSLGVESEIFPVVVPTGKREKLDGFEFEQLRRRDGTQGRIREIWWSGEAALPLRVMIDDGPSKIEVVVHAIRRKVDASVLRDMRERYPAYTVMDISDYREKHHDDAHRE